MTESGSADSITMSSTSLPGSDQGFFNSFYSTLSSRHHGGKTLDSDLQFETDDLKQFHKTFSNLLKQQNGNQVPNWNQQGPLALHRGLEAIASSLSQLTNTIGMALEEQHHVEHKAPHINASDIKYKDIQGSHQLNSFEKANSEKHLSSPSKPQVNTDATVKNTQMRASQEIAMSMGTKAKLLLREFKGVKQGLVFTKERCLQLEEENKRLRESIDKGVRHEEDDLVRLQLEALLTEKARLAQENATFARENQFLHEVVQYHQLKLRELAITDESLAMMDDGVDFDEQGVAMEVLPLYPDETVEEAFLACDASQEI